jgi:hypothetical protein
VLSGRGLCDELITRPEESYRLWCVVCVIQKPREWGGHDPRWAAAPQKQANKQTNKQVYIYLSVQERTTTAGHYPVWTHGEGTRFWNNISAVNARSVHCKFKTVYVFVLSNFLQ